MIQSHHQNTDKLGADAAKNRGHDIDIVKSA